MLEVQRSFAEEFGRIVLEKDTSIRRLARLSGVPRRTLENWLYGNTLRPRHIEPILLVARALHLPTQDIDKLLQAAGHPALVRLQQHSYRHDSELSIPLVGRSFEWQRLQMALHVALQGQAHFVAIRGDAGIGKTRLVEELVEWAKNQDLIIAKTRSYHTDGSLAYATVAELLRQYHLADRLYTLSDTWLVEIARLVPEAIAEKPDLVIPAPLTEIWQRSRFYEALARAILVGNRPVVLVLDDLQWIDRETLEWLHYLLQFDTHARLLIVGAFRDHEIDEDHALTRFLGDLRQNDLLTDIRLPLLGKEDSVSLAENVFGSKLGPEDSEQLFSYFAGNPLFIVETIRARFARTETDLGDVGTISPIPSPSGGSASLPPKIIAVIQSRFVQLSLEARSLLELAATFGRSFEYQVLLIASSMSADKLVENLNELWKRRIIRELDVNVYDFSHDLIRDVAVARISIPQKRALHLRIAQALETVYADHLEDIAGQLAVQFEKAGLLESAIIYFKQVAQADQEIRAYQNMISHLEKGIECLNQMPRSPQNNQQELMMQLSLGFALFQTRGSGDPVVGEAFSKAQRLGEISDQHAELFRAMYGLVTIYMMRADLQRMLDLGQQCLDLARRTGDTGQMMIGHQAIGVASFFKGDFLEAREHLQQICDLYDPIEHQSLGLVYGQDPGVTGFAYLGFTLWFLGYPDRALSSIENAWNLAKQLQHPFTETTNAFYLSLFHLYRQEASATQTWAQLAIELGVHEQRVIEK